MQRDTWKYFKFEKFRYDKLNRLRADSLNAYNYRNTSYSDNGNIENRSDIGDYNYGDYGPHAVSSLEETTGNLLPATSQTVDYTAFNKASYISQGNLDYFIIYPDRLRRKTQLNSGIGDDVLLTKYYAFTSPIGGFGDYEKETTQAGTRHLHYIAAGDGLAAIYVKNDGGVDSLYFIMKDHLGSITGAINNETGKVYRQSFDAWGRKRNPENWTYSNIPDNFPFMRGYTGHEHLKWFGLINMNGRMYDAALCRFLSPDLYVQMPDYSQNFNRYSYALNNPLVYTDPSGEFFVWDSWLMGLVDGFFSSGSNRFDNAWDEANLRGGNDIKIWGGLFVTDPNKNFGGQVWEVFSRFTWQLPQTIGGFGTAHSFNTFGLSGGIESVDYKYGATVLKTRNDGWGGVTQGSFIVGDNSIEANTNNPLFQHEYGHYIQSQSMGWAYYPRVGIPSLFSKKFNRADFNSRHNYNPVEQDANVRAIKYFQDNVDDFTWDFNKNPIGFPGNAWTMDDYYSSNFQNLLNVLTIKPNLLDYYLPLFLITGLINTDNYNTRYVNYQKIYYGKRK